MFELTGKQRRYLRGQGNPLSPAVQIGTAGLTEAVIAQIADALTRAELVKVRFAEVSGADRKTFAIEIASAVEAECVGVTGRTALLYRQNPDLPAGARVRLP